MLRCCCLDFFVPGIAPFQYLHVPLLRRIGNYFLLDCWAAAAAVPSYIMSRAKHSSFCSSWSSSALFYAFSLFSISISRWAVSNLLSDLPALCQFAFKLLLLRSSLRQAFNYPSRDPEKSRISMLRSGNKWPQSACQAVKSRTQKCSCSCQVARRRCWFAYCPEQQEGRSVCVWHTEWQRAHN